MSLPILHLAGTPYEQGLQHGEALKGQIGHNLDVYFERFAREVELSREEVLLRAVEYLRAIERQNPDYAAAMDGVARGSGFELDQIAALNVRYELLYDEFGKIALADGCTAFAVSPDAMATGQLLIGQNWDWIPGVRCAVLHTVDPDGAETLGVTEAGIVGAKIGLNAAGLGLAINGLTTTDDDWSRLSKPFHIRCYEILRAPNLDAAQRIVTDTPRACSTNFLLAQVPDQVVDLEAAPETYRALTCAAGCLVHANHFLVPEALGVVETPSEQRPISCHRQGRLQALLDAGQPCTIGTVQRALRDHLGYPNSVCRHGDPAERPEERYVTVVSVLMNLHERALYVSDGNPCDNDFERISWRDA